MIETIKLGTLRWSHLFRPTEEELQGLQDYYHFHPLDIEDCKSLVNLRPKIDIYHDYLFLILHFPSMDIQGEFVEAKEIKVFPGALRPCIVCQGRTYCITGGCANTPCGWICG